MADRLDPVRRDELAVETARQLMLDGLGMGDVADVLLRGAGIIAATLSGHDAALAENIARFQVQLQLFAEAAMDQKRRLPQGENGK